MDYHRGLDFSFWRIDEAQYVANRAAVKKQAVPLVTHPFPLVTLPFVVSQELPPLESYNMAYH
jgi:hypothetical protein